MCRNFLCVYIITTSALSLGLSRRDQSSQTDMDAKQSKIRVLMLPWLAQGHISPFLELANRLSKRNFHVYLCSTPINLSFITKRLAAGDSSSSVESVELHLPYLPDLPPTRHTTNGLPPHLSPALKTAFDMAAPSFAAILQNLAPDLLIYDFQAWPPAAAASLNIPAVQFLTTAASAASVAHHISKFPEAEYPFPDLKLEQSHAAQQFLNLVKANSNRKEGVMEAIERSCGIILYNTFRELEGKYIDYLSTLSGKKIVPVGPLVQEIDAGSENTEILKWLDEKESSSTVFVSFGSEFFPSKEDMEELAHGLEQSEVNFIWVIRFPAGEKATAEEALPEGFSGKVGKRGLLVEGWAPQAKILGHRSTGGFVTHCGWNSTLEALSFGVPMVGVPMHLDQPVVARMVAAAGVAVDVARGENGRLNREEIARGIRKVVVEENGEGIRDKAREFSDIIRRIGEEGVDEAADEFRRICKERRSS
ncbi:UDP-glucosyltransferase 29-like [Diospyros lotus]|uniref:UDP-glucosyltransferase 29-like n=1 Tax=Diospyros lotus TaxID=55363 RepID=UPI00225078F6|nr:UDP-glucosyltransferase 29-like [Diospyros lotus]